MKGKLRRALATGFAVAALTVGTTAVAAPVHADDGTQCSTNHDGGKGYANCKEPNNPKLHGVFSAKYQCAGQEGHSFKTGTHVADGNHPIRMECAPHSAVVSVSVSYSPFGS
jgi:hypothetical protein